MVDLPTLASEMERDPSDDPPSPSPVPAVLATVCRRDISGSAGTRLAPGRTGYPNRWRAKSIANRYAFRPHCPPMPKFS
jgi:hypothetical protein